MFATTFAMSAMPNYYRDDYQTDDEDLYDCAWQPVAEDFADLGWDLGMDPDGTMPETTLNTWAADKRAALVEDSDAAWEAEASLELDYVSEVAAEKASILIAETTATTDAEPVAGQICAWRFWCNEARKPIELYSSVHWDHPDYVRRLRYGRPVAAKEQPWYRRWQWEQTAQHARELKHQFLDESYLDPDREFKPSREQRCNKDEKACGCTLCGWDEFLPDDCEAYDEIHK